MQEDTLAGGVFSQCDCTDESRFEPQPLGTRESRRVLTTGSCSQFPRRELTGTLTPAQTGDLPGFSRRTGYSLPSCCFPTVGHDHGRSKMVFKTRCSYTSTNKPPSGPLIVVGCAMVGSGVGGGEVCREGLIGSRSSLCGKISGEKFLLLN